MNADSGWGGGGTDSGWEWGLKVNMQCNMVYIDCYHPWGRACPGHGGGGHGKIVQYAMQYILLIINVSLDPNPNLNLR